MAGNPNPVEQIGGLATTDDVSKPDTIAWAKQRVAQVIATASELRTFDLSGQLMVFLKSNGRTYVLDTSDTTTADDGETCIRDANGLGFFIIEIDGVDGADGSDPGVLLTWDTGTSDADPGTGEIRANNASLASATVLYISKTNRLGDSIAAFLAALDDSTNTAKGGIVLTDTTSDTQATFVVGAVTDASGYIKLAVSVPSGATAFTAGHGISFQFARSGDVGAAGLNGTNGISGASALTRVRVVATTNVAISTALENGDAIDSVTLATNDLVLLTGQTAPSENGVYVVSASGAASRHTDFDAYNELAGSFFSVMEGTLKADTLWYCTSNPGGTINSTAVAISQFSSGTTGRELLTGNRTYYVRTDGSDSNNGLANTSGGAFLTIQKALNVAASLDCSTFNVTIQVGDGTYTGAVVLPQMLGSGTFLLQGNTTTSANVLISVTSNNAITCQVPVTWSISGFKIATTTAGSGISASGGCSLVLIKIDFGAVAYYQITASFASINVTGNYTISGGALAHYRANAFANISAGTSTVTLSGTPAFSIFADAAFPCNLNIQTGIVTFSGAATGQRYSSQLNAVIYTANGGATYFPGNSAGQVATGGQYT